MRVHPIRFTVLALFAVACSGVPEAPGIAPAGAVERIVSGSDEDDVLQGGGGHDVLYGGDGDDVLYGDGGSNVLIGGAGADRFVFSPASERDHIVDFRPEEGDVIELAGFEVEAIKNGVRIEGTTLEVKGKGVDVWIPVADLERSDLSVGTLLREKSLRFSVAFDF